MEESKLFVVIAVLVIILLGIGTYLFFIDRKVSMLLKKIEKEQNSANKS